MSSINESVIDTNVNNIVQPIVNKSPETILMEEIKEAYGVTTTTTTVTATESSAPKEDIKPRKLVYPDDFWHCKCGQYATMVAYRVSQFCDYCPPEEDYTFYAPKYFITCPLDVEDGTYRHGDCYCSSACFMR